MPSAHVTATWETPPMVLIGAALALILFVQAFVRLRRRRAEHAPWTRALLFAMGLALLVVPLVSPLDHVGDEDLLSAHMLQHVLIGDAAPALLVTAVRGPLLFFLLPPALLRPFAASRPLRAFLSVLLRPLVSLGLWAVALVAWHVPGAYDYAAAHPLVHDLEHLSFVVAGTLAWTQLVDPARQGRLRRPQRVFFALAMLALAQPLVDVLLFSSGPAYARYAAQSDRLFGISPLTDQRLAGVVMMVEQLLALGICVALLLRPYLKERGGRLRGPALPARIAVNAPAASSFSFEPLFLALAVGLVYGYARLAKTVDRPRPGRTALFVLGALLIATSLNSPLETIAVHYLLVVHLLQNVMIADWAPPLLVLGLTPAMRAALAARAAGMLAFLTRPRVALPLWLAVWYGVHLPAFYDYALRHPLLLNVEHGALILAGLVFWWPVFSSEPNRLSTAVRLVYLGAAYAGSAFLSLALIFSARAFYGFYEAAPRLWGLSPQKDQNLGGILMNAEQMAVFFVAMSYFLLRLLSEEEESQQALEGR